MDEIKIKEKVRERYAAVAAGVAEETSSGCCGGTSCCGPELEVVALADYGALGQAVPEGADLGLGCGIPTLYAGIRPGDTVLDLGSGAGVDVFLAARQVGPTGRVIGVDMTPEMIARAWENAVKGGFRNVDFRLGEIENLPVASETVDVVISNCVINLVPDKARVFAEVFRALKPGGRFSISDMVTYGDIPPEIRTDMELWTGCIAGAMDRQAYLQVIAAAGFVDVQVKQFVECDYLKGDDYGIASLTVEGRKG